MEPGHRTPSDQPPIAYHGGFPDPPYSAIGQPPNNAAPQLPPWDQASANVTRLWAPSPGYGGHLVDEYDFRSSCYGPPPGHFFNTLLPAPVNIYGPPQELRAGPQPPRPLSDSNERRQQQQDEGFRAAVFGGSLHPPMGHDHHWRTGTVATEPEEEETSRKRQDVQWLQQFLKNSNNVASKSPRSQPRQRPYHDSVPALRDALYAATRLLLTLEESCYTLRHNLDNDSVWTDSHRTALRTKRELEDRVELLSHRDRLNEVKAKLNRGVVRGARRLRRRRLLQLDEDHRQQCISEREAAIDAWRIMQIQAVEERKRVR